jgi:hypothetical protein
MELIYEVRTKWHGPPGGILIFTMNWSEELESIRQFRDERYYLHDLVIVINQSSFVNTAWSSLKISRQDIS